MTRNKKWESGKFLVDHTFDSNMLLAALIILADNAPPEVSLWVMAERVAQLPRLLDCHSVIGAHQRLKAVEVPIAADEIRPIFFHSDSPLRMVEPNGD
jgi:hypothetical protein